MSGLRETDRGHAVPRIADVIRRARVATHLAAPLPHFRHAVLAHAENDVAFLLSQMLAHHHVRFLRIGFILVVARYDLVVAAPVILEIIKAPFCETLRILFLVLPTGDATTARLRAGRRIDSSLESELVD